MSKENRQWLAKQLPELLAEKIINQDVLERISQHFALAELPQEESGLSRMTIILAAIGGLLIGGGIIMLFAHNWDNLSRTIRTWLALGPLVLSQVFVLMALFPKERGRAWREASAALMFCAVPASIALIGQTYHISNDAQAFQTAWFWLIVPFVYLLRSKLAAMLAMILAANMAIMYQSQFWIYPLVLLPFYFLPNPYGLAAKNAKVGWVFALATAIALPISLLIDHDHHPSILLIVMSGAVALYLLGGLREQQYGFWNRSFTNVGAVSIAINLLFYSFEDVWSELSRVQSMWLGETGLLPYSLIGIALIGLFYVLRNKRFDLLPLASTILLACIPSFVPVSYWQPVLFSVVANLVVFALGVWYLWLGVKYDSGSRLNFGLILIMSIIMLRFFDQDFSFIVKGLAFIAMGIALIVVNVWQNRRSRK